MIRIVASRCCLRYGPLTDFSHFVEIWLGADHVDLGRDEVTVSMIFCLKLDCKHFTLWLEGRADVGTYDVVQKGDNRDPTHWTIAQIS